MEVESFVEIENEFIERISRMVWCNVATLDMHNRPRSRVLHPIWEGPRAWILTRRHSYKARHIDHSPYVSLAYIADVAKPVYADCIAEWADDLAAKQHVWDLFLATPVPLGYDPAPIFKSPDNPDCGLLKLTPWRVQLYSFPDPSPVWHNAAAQVPTR